MEKNAKANKKDVGQIDAKKAAFAYRLRNARERAGKSQSELFQLIREGRISPEDGSLVCDKSPLTSFMSYNLYEQARNFPPLPELRRLAYHCNVSADELLGMYDARYFYKLIKSVFRNTYITTTGQPLDEGEWPNDTNQKLQIKVTAPTGEECCPPINILEGIRKSCWNQYQAILTEQISSYLHRELFRNGFNYSEEQMAFFKRLAFVALNELFKEPIISKTQTAAKAFEDFQKTIRNNRELYEGCFNGSIDNAIFFFLVTNINPVDSGNRIPALFKLYALKMNNSRTNPQFISPAAFEKGLEDMIQSPNSTLLKKLFFDDLSYFKDNPPFNNDLYRFLISRIDTFITGADKQAGPQQPNGSTNDILQNKKRHLSMKKLLLDKLVMNGRYWEDDKWKAFADYSPAFLTDANMPMTADEFRQKLAKELFGPRQEKPTGKGPIEPIKDIKFGGQRRN